MNLDYRVYHSINVFVSHHSWLGPALSQIENYAVPLIAIATFALWFLDRPGAQRKWKLASASALAAAAAALVANQLIAQVWHRTRPFASHPSAHVWGSRSHDPSFPSDHASAAFAIAFTVLLFDRLAGALFLVAAVIVGFGRIVIGAHYPADVLAGVLGGLAAALLVAKLGRKFIEVPVGWVEQLTDPVVARLWDPPNRGNGHAVKAAAQKVAFDNGGAFIRDTRHEVEQYLARGSTSLKGSLLLYAKAPVAIGLTAASWAVLVFARPGVVGAFLCLAGLVLGALLTAFCVQHDANHGAYFRRRRHNHLLGWSADALLGFSSYAWRVKHNVAHHTLEVTRFR